MRPGVWRHGEQISRTSDARAFRSRRSCAQTLSVLVDQAGLPARPPGERADTDAPSGVDPVHLHGPPVAPGDRVQESEPDTTSFGPQLNEAL